MHVNSELFSNNLTLANWSSTTCCRGPKSRVQPKSKNQLNEQRRESEIISNSRRSMQIREQSKRKRQGNEKRKKKKKKKQKNKNKKIKKEKKKEKMRGVTSSM